MNRLELLEAIYAGRTRLEAVLEQLQPAQMIIPSLPGGWSVKDLLAHLGWWEQHALDLVQQPSGGAIPDYPLPDAEVDAVNARIQADFCSRDLDDVRKFEREAYHRVLQMVETASEANLFEPGRFAWFQGGPLSEWILSNSGGHFDEHLPDLRALLPHGRVG